MKKRARCSPLFASLFAIIRLEFGQFQIYAYICTVLLIIRRRVILSQDPKLPPLNILFRQDSIIVCAIRRGLCVLSAQKGRLWKAVGFGVGKKQSPRLFIYPLALNALKLIIMGHLPVTGRCLFNPSKESLNISTGRRSALRRSQSLYVYEVPCQQFAYET